MPAAGGTYVYLQEAFGSSRWGRLWSFVYLWGATLVMPLIGAFVAVSLAQYALYLWPAMPIAENKLLAVGACLSATALLYRDIRSVGRLSKELFFPCCCSCRMDYRYGVIALSTDASLRLPASGVLALDILLYRAGNGDAHRAARLWWLMHRMLVRRRSPGTVP